MQVQATTPGSWTLGKAMQLRWTRCGNPCSWHLIALVSNWIHVTQIRKSTVFRDDAARHDLAKQHQWNQGKTISSANELARMLWWLCGRTLVRTAHGKKPCSLVLNYKSELNCSRWSIHISHSNLLLDGVLSLVLVRSLLSSSLVCFGFKITDFRLISTKDG